MVFTNVSVKLSRLFAAVSPLLLHVEPCVLFEQRYLEASNGVIKGSFLTKHHRNVQRIRLCWYAEWRPLSHELIEYSAKFNTAGGRSSVKKKRLFIKQDVKLDNCFNVNAKIRKHRYLTQRYFLVFY